MESKYWLTLKELDLFSDVTPLNSTTEKVIFFNELEKGNHYNPIFDYKKRNKGDLKKLNKAKKFLPKDEFISVDYLDHYTEKEEWLECFTERTSSLFSQKLSALHPAPSENDIIFAKKNLTNSLKFPDDEEQFTFSTNHATELFQSELEKNNYNWDIKVKDISAKAMVSSLTKELIIRKNAKFSVAEIKRLIVHEIGTHVKRFENGCKQKFEIYKYGFKNYLEAEEGLAMYNENLHGLLSHKDLKKYSLRVIACSLAAKGSFSEVYKQIASYTSKEEAWNITLRVKRGLINTASHGGFLKDQLYLNGYKKVSCLTKAQINSLWIGKIGINQIAVQ